MRVLITGVAGFIGSHLADRFLKDGHTVIGIDNFSSGKQENIKHLYGNPNFFIDMVDCRRKIEKTSPVDLIIHLAATGSVPRSMREPTHYMENNVMGFHNVLEWAREKGVKKVFYASSSSVYGHSGAPVRLEYEAVEPISPYAATKLMNEVQASTYGIAYGIRCTGLRFFNVFGPRQAEGQYAAVVPKFCQALKAGENIQIFGNGEQIRTFTPVGFVVEAIYRMSRISFLPEIVNVTDISYAEKVIDLALKMGITLDKIYYAPPRAGDIERSVGGSHHLKNILNDLNAKDFPIDQALRETIEYYQTTNKGF